MNKTEKRAKTNKTYHLQRLASRPAEMFLKQDRKLYPKRKRNLPLKTYEMVEKKNNQLKKQTKKKTIKPAETYHLQSHNLKCLQEKKRRTIK
jgi:hypothetical protein